MNKRKPSASATRAAELLEARAGITSLPSDMQDTVRGAFSDLIDYRVKLLGYWRQVPRALRRGEAVKVSRAWSRKAHLLSPLYPCLTIFPMPLILDAMLATIDAGRDPGALAALALDLEHLQLDRDAAKRLTQLSREASR